LSFELKPILGFQASDRTITCGLTSVVPVQVIDRLEYHTNPKLTFGDYGGALEHENSLLPKPKATVTANPALKTNGMQKRMQGERN
jgi:hypothetical protein